MPQIVQVKSRVLAAITDKTSFANALKEAGELAAEYSLKVADMPMAIQAMAGHHEVYKAIRPLWTDTLTSECLGLRDGRRSYEAWHSVGPLATAEGLEAALPKAGDYAFMQIADDEWASVRKGNYHGRNVARIHLPELRRGAVPPAGTPYSVALAIPDDYTLIPLNADMKEVLEMHSSGKLIIFERGQLNSEQFRLDDTIAALCGSPANVESLCKILFGEEGWNSVGSHHRIKEAVFGAQAKGRPAYVGNSDYGPGGSEGVCVLLNLNGRFAAVGALHGESGLKEFYP